MKQFYFFKTAVLLFLITSLAACQSNNGSSTVGGYFDLDTDLQINFKIDADINPDELGKASPLFVRMYELKTKKMMKKADFIEIYERDKEVLGADMVAVHKLKHFKPGSQRTEHFVLSPKTRYVALYGEFLEFKDSKFKLIIPVVANNVFRNSVVVRVSTNELILEQEAVQDPDSDDDSEFKENKNKLESGMNKVKDIVKKPW